MRENPGNAPSVPSSDYAAFISYSHDDAKAAAWLQGAIERYAVPRRLVGRETRFGPIPPRLGKCFRDRDELPASSDLNAEILNAIMRSHFMIVLCSPAAARSQWVDQEIIAFKRHRSADRIIAVITGGEPFAQGNAADQECFPAALRFQVDADGSLTDRPAEPIAADLRPNKDGKRMVRLKVLAGMLGIGLDELVQREAQRRQRVYGWLAACALLMSAAFAGLAVVAWQQRNIAIMATAQARDKRTQAEGLIEFMIKDLREKLEPVGRLDVLDAVSERALAYFATMSPQELVGTSAGQKTRVLILLGQDQTERGEQGKALQTFLQAWEAARLALAQDPDDPDRLHEYAEASDGVGYGYYAQSDLVSAGKYFDESMRTYYKIISKHDMPKNWQELDIVLRNIGVIQFNLSRFDEALKYLTKSVDIARTQYYTDTSNSQLANDYGQSLAWTSDVLRLLGETSKSIELRNSELGVYNTLLHSHPNDKKIARNAIFVRRRLALLKLEKGDYDAASSAINSVEREIEDQFNFDKSNMYNLFILTGVTYDGVEAAISENDYEKARDKIEIGNRRFAYFESLVDKSSNLLKMAKDYSVRTNCMYLFEIKNYQEIINLSAEYVNDLAQYAKEKKYLSDSIYAISDRITIAYLAANALDRNGAREKSSDILRLVSDIIRQFPEPRNIQLEAILFRSLLQLGDKKESEQSLSIVCKSEYRRIIGKNACGNLSIGH